MTDSVPAATPPSEPTTTVAQTTTTVAPTTTIAPTTTTTTTTTTVAPTTTIDPIAELLAAIERDLNLGEQALLAATADPGNATLRQELETYYSGSSLQLTLELLDQLVADGLLGRANPEDPSVIRAIRVEQQSSDPATEPVLVELCRVDSAVIYEPLPEGGEIIVNDVIAVTRSRSRVFLLDGVWVLDGGDVIERLDSGARCD